MATEVKARERERTQDRVDGSSFHVVTRWYWPAFLKPSNAMAPSACCARVSQSLGVSGVHVAMGAKRRLFAITFFLVPFYFDI